MPGLPLPPRGGIGRRRPAEPGGPPGRPEGIFPGGRGGAPGPPEEDARFGAFNTGTPPDGRRAGGKPDNEPRGAPCFWEGGRKTGAAVFRVPLANGSENEGRPTGGKLRAPPSDGRDGRLLPGGPEIEPPALPGPPRRAPGIEVGRDPGKAIGACGRPCLIGGIDEPEELVGRPELIASSGEFTESRLVRPLLVRCLDGLGIGGTFPLDPVLFPLPGRDGGFLPAVADLGAETAAGARGLNGSSSTAFESGAIMFMNGSGFDRIAIIAGGRCHG